MDKVQQNLRGLVLGAVDVKRLTGWPESMVEDYLSIFDNLNMIAKDSDESNSGIKTIYNTSSTPFVVPADANVVFVDTDIQDIDILLQEGINGKELRIVTVGTNGNVANIIPNGLELLYGENVPLAMYDIEAIIIDYSDTYGWA